MRVKSKLFRLSAAAAMAGMVFGPAIPMPAYAQPAPPQAAPGQNAVDPPAQVGRLALMSGAVSFHAVGETQWTSASVNYPIATGDAYWTEPNAGATFEISDNLVALAGGTELDVATLDASGLQATLPQGESYYRIRGFAPNETWTVQTPRGQVTLQGAGRYEIAAGDTQDPTTVTVLEGAVQITGPHLSVQVSGNQTAIITGADTFQASVGPARQDAFLVAMLARERPVVQSPAPAIVAAMPGGYSLAGYGAWQTAPEYGQVWYPQVAAGWAPYRDGHWAYIPPWGWTWVDNDPWGFAPFHYGRWVQIGGRWGWTPGTIVVAGPPVYAPALVAFIGLGVGVGLGAALAAGSVGWIPLGPHEAYHPWYHASPRYIQEVNVRHVTNITNFNSVNNYANRGAATVVPASVMAGSRPVQQAYRPVSPQLLASARPISGQEPIRPTAATAGVTPGYAQRMHFAPAPAGMTAHVAPGPVIRAEATEARPGAAARPPLAAPGHPASVPATHAGPGGAPELRAPGAGRPAVPAEHGPVTRTTPHAGEPTTQHGVEGTPTPHGVEGTTTPHRVEGTTGTHGQAPASTARPVEHAPTPQVHTAPPVHAPQVEHYPAPQVREPQAFHPAPEAAHPAPRPAPQPQAFHAPPEAAHPAAPHPVPHAAPEHAAAPPAAHREAEPAHHEEKRPGQP